MKQTPASPRPAAFQVDSAVLLYLVIVGNSMSYVICHSGLNFTIVASILTTQAFVYIGCFVWFLFWRKKSFNSQSEKMKFWRQEKIRAGFWHSLGQTLGFFWVLSILSSFIYYEVIHLLLGKNPLPFASSGIACLFIFTINACVGSFIPWKITQRMVNVPIKQERMPQIQKN